MCSPQDCAACATTATIIPPPKRHGSACSKPSGAMTKPECRMPKRRQRTKNQEPSTKNKEPSTACPSAHAASGPCGASGGSCLHGGCQGCSTPSSAPEHHRASTRERPRPHEKNAFSQHRIENDTRSSAESRARRESTHTTRAKSSDASPKQPERGNPRAKQWPNTAAKTSRESSEHAEEAIKLPQSQELQTQHPLASRQKDQSPAGERSRASSTMPVVAGSKGMLRVIDLTPSLQYRL